MFQDYERIIDRMQDELKEINGVRRKIIIRYIVGWLMLPISFVVPGIISIVTGGAVQVLFALIMFGATLWSFLFLLRTYGKFRYAFRDIIVKEMVGHIIETCELPEEYPGSELEYTYGLGRKISSLKIARSGLFFLGKNSRYRGHDRIMGKIGLTEFDFSAITLYKRVRKHSNHTSRSYKDKKKFKGILFLADFNKNFRGHTVLRDKNIRSFRHLKRYILHALNNLFRKRKLERINLEDKAFNRLFTTKTSNEIEARYVLTPNFMERLVTFRKKRRNPIDISFRNSNIAIALSAKKFFFEPSIFRRMKNGQVKDVYDDLIFFFSIIEDLNLNKRIWSK